jgi:hypothetical protein
MNCPNCGKREKVRVKVCTDCGEAYASEDLTTFRQLEFLLSETSHWEGVDLLREPYQDELEKLRSRLVKPKPAEPEIVEVEVPELEPVIVPEEAVEISPEAIAAPSSVLRPTKEAVREVAKPVEKPPFDEWLLSERNIKMALYGGALMLVIAGLIFVSVNWARIPGPAKFANTVMITGLTFLAGYIVVQRPAYKLGGIALLGLGCGFLALNFMVLQIYVLGPEGLEDEVMWLIASPLLLIAYAVIAYWTRGDLFTYIAVAALASCITAAQVVAGAPIAVYFLVFALLALGLLALAWRLQSASIAEFTHQPLLYTSQLALPFVIAASLGFWANETGCQTACSSGSPWLAILALVVGAVFYTGTDLGYKWLLARWAAIALIDLAAIMAVIESGMSDTVAGLILMVLALVQLVAGSRLELRTDDRKGSLPLYIGAGALALLVTGLAFGDVDTLIKVLFGDVLLLVVAGWIFQDYRWAYPAVWLFMVPVYLIISISVRELVFEGLLLGLLGLNYVVAGYALARRDRLLGWPFLSATALLSVLVLVMTLENPALSLLTSVVVAALYLLVGLWLEWPLLLLPALIALDLAVLAANRVFYSPDSPLEPALAISYAFLGAATVIGGLFLRRAGRDPWGWPLYLIGTINLIFAYITALIIGGWLAVGLSAVIAILTLAFSWAERDLFEALMLPPLLTYLGAGVIFVGAFFVLDSIAGNRALEVWPVVSAGLCGVYIGLSWLLRREPLSQVYAVPLRYTGLGLMFIPMVAVVVLFDPILGAVTFAIAGISYAVDAVLRRARQTAYLAAGAFVMVIWAVLLALDVGEPLAYAVPLGLGLLAVGWNERRNDRTKTYMLPSMLGLAIITGTTFIQSISQPQGYYALLLLAESIVALLWGIRYRVRCYCQIAALAFLANAIVQLGPGLLDLSRWIQIAIIGVILFGGGLLALFKREKILDSRQRVVGQWRQFGP